MAARLAQQAAEQEQSRAPGILAALHDYLLANVRMAPTLERTAAGFGVSPATSSASCRATTPTSRVSSTHVALWLLQVERADNEEVAHYPGFHDAANFRRSFRRWTGLTPGPLRAAGR